MNGPMMNFVPKQIGTATYQDVLDAPEGMVAELIYGVLHTQPRPTPKHSLVGSGLGFELTGPFQRGKDGPGGWWILDEPEVHLGEQVLVPDIAGWRHETLGEFPDAAYFTTAPDWVCEILSPSTRQYDLTDKREIYGSYGVKHIWFVDPDAQTLEAFENRNGEWTLIAALHGDADVCVAPFDAVTLALGDLWPPKPKDA